MAQAADILPYLDLEGYKNRTTAHESKFATFLAYANQTKLAATAQRDYSEYGIQVVTQVNHGAVLSKRYFATAKLVESSESSTFVELTEDEVHVHQLRKENTFKNYRSLAENRFVELNLYKKYVTGNVRAPNAERDGGVIDI